MFQAMLGDDLTSNETATASSSKADTMTETSISDTVTSNKGDNSIDNPYMDCFKDLIGGICRVPFSFEWGNMSFYNAIITGVAKPESEEENPKVCNQLYWNTNLQQF